MSWSQSAANGAKVISLSKAETKDKQDQEGTKDKETKAKAAAAAASSRLSRCNVTLEVVAGPPRMPPQPTEPPPKEPEQEPEVQMEDEDDDDEVEEVVVTDEPPPKKSSSVNNLGSFFLCLAPSCQFETADGEEFLRHEREEHFQVIDFQKQSSTGIVITSFKNRFKGPFVGKLKLSYHEVI